MENRLPFILVALFVIGMGGFGWADERPNILWITSEDNGPHLGCYGDRFAVTPNLDALAETAFRYNRCWSNAPVCAPARTCLITGLYANSTGAEHMRSLTRLPASLRMFPRYLRDAGYYCTNNSKEDYNLEKTGQVWDESGGKAHWRHRPQGQPFFAVFNYTISHESRIRNKIQPAHRIHDPDGVTLPAYHPDTAESRKDWAQYYDRLTQMDQRVGQCLAELAEDGLMENTIVFYFADHGSGMPGNKRSACQAGLNVPLMIRIPDKFAHMRPAGYAAGKATDRLVSFVDFAPTALNLASVAIPDSMQGLAFAGQRQDPPRRYQFGFRGRMDERYDMVRSVSDGRFVLVRNYFPHRPHGQHVDYMFQTPTTRVWQRLYLEGRLNSAQARFWQSRDAEELYDLSQDPDEVVNLAGRPDHREILSRLRRASDQHLLAIRDLGFLPENEIHHRAGDRSPYEMARQPDNYQLEKIKATADLAAEKSLESLPRLIAALDSEDSAIRYWATLGILGLEDAGVQRARQRLFDRLQDSSGFVVVNAAEALARYSGEADDVAAALSALRSQCNPTRDIYATWYALNAIDVLDQKALPLKNGLQQLPRHPAGVSSRSDQNLDKLLDHILLDLQ